MSTKRHVVTKVSVISKVLIWAERCYCSLMSSRKFSFLQKSLYCCASPRSSEGPRSSIPRKKSSSPRNSSFLRRSLFLDPPKEGLVPTPHTRKPSFLDLTKEVLVPTPHKVNPPCPPFPPAVRGDRARPGHGDARRRPRSLPSGPNGRNVPNVATEQPEQPECAECRPRLGQRHQRPYYHDALHPHVGDREHPHRSRSRRNDGLQRPAHCRRYG